MRKALLFVFIAFCGLVLLIVVLPKTVVFYRSPSVSAVIFDPNTGKPIAGASVEVRWDAMRRTGNEHNPDLTNFHVATTLTDKNGVFTIPAWGPVAFTRDWRYYEFCPVVSYSKFGYQKRAFEDNDNNQDSVTAHAIPYGIVTLDRPSWNGGKLPLSVSPNKEENLGGDGNVPINFYGKVVDQEGRPVTEAKITFDVITSQIVGQSGDTPQMTLQTDQDGDFELTGDTAYGIAIDKLSVQKEGYSLSPKTRRFYRYVIAPYKPDPGNPEVVRMWKKHGNEPLVDALWHGKVAGDGTTNRFDLLNGSRIDDGNLELICVCPLLIPRNGLFDFKSEIAVFGGGIQSTDDEFTYLAPESGYSPSITVEHKADAPNQQNEVRQEFYIKTADGRYGRLFVAWLAWQKPSGYCEWNCSINPSGSRDLER